MLRCEICGELAKVEVVLKEDDDHPRFMCSRCRPQDRFLARGPRELDYAERYGMTEGDV